MPESAELLNALAGVQPEVKRLNWPDLNTGEVKVVPIDQSTLVVEDVPTFDMFGKTDDLLIRLAVGYCVRKSLEHQIMPWRTVMRIFAVGSTLAVNLCKRCGYHPDTGARL